MRIRILFTFICIASSGCMSSTNQHLESMDNNINSLSQSVSAAEKDMVSLKELAVAFQQLINTPATAPATGQATALQQQPAGMQDTRSILREAGLQNDPVPTKAEIQKNNKGEPCTSSSCMPL